MNISKQIQILILVLAPACLMSMDSRIQISTQQSLGARPERVQSAIDRVFETIKLITNHGGWNYNGDMEDGYNLLNRDDTDVLKGLVSKQKEHIYIIDVGGAMGSWGVFAMKFLLRDEACQQSGKQFHIFSVTGGKECEESVVRDGNVELINLNKFKIENIDEEFAKRGLDLRGKVDLVVSCWTLIHLVDAFGTLKRIYSLLSPNQGQLMSHGFLFMVNALDEVQTFPSAHLAGKLTTANPGLLLSFDTEAWGGGQFCLTRNNSQELAIPLVYTGEVFKLPKNPKYSGQIVTVFINGSL